MPNRDQHRRQQHDQRHSLRPARRFANTITQTTTPAGTTPSPIRRRTGAVFRQGDLRVRRRQLEQQADRRLEQRPLWHRLQFRQRSGQCRPALPGSSGCASDDLQFRREQQHPARGRLCGFQFPRQRKGGFEWGASGTQQSERQGHQRMVRWWQPRPATGQTDPAIRGRTTRTLPTSITRHGPWVPSSR